MVNKTPNKSPYEGLDEVFVIGSTKEEGGEERVTSFWSPTKYPPLKIKTNNVIREIEVVVSSIENEDMQLLHRLLSKTRDQI